MISDAMIALIKREPFFAKILMGMRREYSTRIATAGVSVTDQVNLIINPNFWPSLSVNQQAAVLKHECISGKNLIHTDKGLISIKEIVEKKLDVKVLSISPEGILEFKEIISYSQRDIEDHLEKRWIGLKYCKAQGLYAKPIVTNDHRISYISTPFDTEIKYTEAEKSIGLYNLRYVNTERSNNKERPNYNKTQVEVMVGCLIGDSGISSSGVFKSVASLKKEEYLKHKADILGGKIVRSYSGYRNDYTNLSVSHGTSEQTKYMYELFYENKKRTVKNILHMITDISLAFWFMDDGSWSGYGTSFLHTEGLSYSDNVLLQSMFKDRFNIEVDVMSRIDKPELFCLKFKKEATDKLHELVAPYIHKSMAYKIQERFRHLCETKTIDNKFLDYSIKKITEVVEMPKNVSKLYDIGVKDNHNFFANNSLVHNCLHIVFNHLGRGEAIGKFDNMMNIAADIAINQMIEDLPEGAMTVEMFQKEVPDLEHGRTMEYYYSKIKHLKDKYNTLDDHSEWGGSGSEYIREKIRELVEGAVNTLGINNVPGNVLVAIKDLRNSKKNWKNELQRFVSKQNETLLEQSRKVRNRRYGILYPGHKKVSKLTLAIAVDTSGSVSDEALSQFFTEIKKIHANGVNLKIIECDSGVMPSYDYDPKKPIKVHGRGGTEFGPAFDEANKLDIDGLIYFTDGDAFDTPQKPKYPVLWAIVGNSKPPVDFGSITRVEVI